MAQRHHMKGLVATGWSRYDALRPQCDPMEACLDLMAAVGNVLRDGQVAEHALDHWTRQLAQSGHEHLPALKELLAQFSTLRNVAWTVARQAREQLCCLRGDPRHQALTLPPQERTHLQGHVRELEEVADRIGALLAGKTPSIWVERYCAERLIPLREELAEIERRTEAPKAKPKVLFRPDTGLRVTRTARPKVEL